MELTAPPFVAEPLHRVNNNPFRPEDFRSRTIQESKKLTKIELDIINPNINQPPFINCFLTHHEEKPKALSRRRSGLADSQRDPSLDQ